MINVCLRLFIVVALSLAVNGCHANAQKNAVADSAWLMDGSPWYEQSAGFETAETEWEKKQLPMMVYFYTDWCSYCRRFDSGLLVDPSVRQQLKHVIKVRINPEKGVEEEKIAQKYGVKGYPSVFVLASGSKDWQRIYPFRRVGYSKVLVPPSDFIQMCNEMGASVSLCFESGTVKPCGK